MSPSLIKKLDLLNVNKKSVLERQVIGHSLAAQHYSTAISILLMLTAFFIPISVSLKSACLIVASCMIIAQNGHMLTALFRRPWFWAALILFFVIFLGCFISPVDMSISLNLLGKYSKLLFLPLLVLGFQTQKNRYWAIHGFLLAMVITCIGSFLKVMHVFKGIGDGAVDASVISDPGAVFYNHIVTGYFMAFAVFLACVFASRSVGLVRYGYYFLAGLLAYQVLFINPGRTGYFMLALLMAIYTIYLMRKSPILSILLLVVGLLLSQTSLVKRGVSHVIDDLTLYQQGHKNSSVGYRLQFHHYAEQLFIKNPLLGVGTGGFSYSFQQDNPVVKWGNQLFEPHGEYWFIASEHGLLGLLALAFFFWSLFHELNRQNEMKLIFLGMMITFLIGCCSDGLLLLSVPGYFFIFFIAMGLGEALENTPINK